MLGWTSFWWVCCHFCKKIFNLFLVLCTQYCIDIYGSVKDIIWAWNWLLHIEGEFKRLFVNAKICSTRPHTDDEQFSNKCFLVELLSLKEIGTRPGWESTQMIRYIKLKVWHRFSSQNLKFAWRSLIVNIEPISFIYEIFFGLFIFLETVSFKGGCPKKWLAMT